MFVQNDPAKKARPRAKRLPCHALGPELEYQPKADKRKRMTATMINASCNMSLIVLRHTGTGAYRPRRT
jgi:hypothetical protein